MLETIPVNDDVAEKNSSESFSLQNAHLLKVVLNGDILARKGAMVAHQGQISFEHHSAGMSRLAKKVLSSDQVSLMHARGQGDLFLAVGGLRIRIIHLDNETITVEPGRLLAFDQDIDWNLEMTGKISRMYAGGLWHMRLSGSGFVALLSDGEPVLLDCSQGTAIDRNALVAWGGQVETSIRRDTSFKTYTGRASGESIQLYLEGPGWVLVQPSEVRISNAADDGASGGFFSTIADVLTPFS